MFIILNYPARGPGRVGKWEMIFSTDRADKGEMNFLTGWAVQTKENSIFQRIEPKEKKDDDE